MNMKLYRIVLPVQKIEKATDFYSKLLAQEGKKVSDGRHYFDCGGVILVCYDSQADGDKDIYFRPNPDHIYLATDKLEEVYQTAKSLACLRIDESIETQPWGERCFYFVDPFGNQICMTDEKTIFKG
jgi:uncharacterized glyoxalase superfamily protein PhnB